MTDWKQQVLDRIDTGIIILDISQRIIYWNKEMEKLSGIFAQDACEKYIAELYPKFAQARYQTIIENVFSAGQNRFCSSALHKNFILPAGANCGDVIRQNMKIEPIWNNEKVEYAFLHISDITEYTQNERKLKEQNEKLSEGYKTVKASEQAAKKMARYDHLTGTLNRCAMKPEVEKLIKRANEDSEKVALFFIDLDCFKQVNDTYGHIVGDALLQHIAGRLLNNTRHSRDRAYDIVARVGGDEFILAMSGIKCRNDIDFMANKISNLIRKPFFIGDDKINVSSSIGIAVYPDDAVTIDVLIDIADKAMYRIKQNGKNAYTFYGDLRQTLNWEVINRNSQPFI